MLKFISIFSLVILPLTGYSQCANSGVNGPTSQQQAECNNRFMGKVIAQSNVEAAAFLKNERITKTNFESVGLCSSALSPDSSGADVSKAISCLQKNPYAGEGSVESFLTKNASLVAKIKEEIPAISTDIDALMRQKKEKLYWSVATPKGKALYVGNLYNFDNPTGSVVDLWALEPRMITKNHLIGADETVPFKDVKSFSFVQSGNEIGMFEVTTTSQKLQDKSFQGEFSSDFGPTNVEGKFAIILMPSAKLNKPGVLISLEGAAYVEGQTSYKVEKATLSLRQAHLNRSVVTVISEAEANAIIARVENAVGSQKQAQASQQAENASKRDKLISRIQSAAKGDEDSCEGSTNAWHPFNDGTVLKCQLIDGITELGFLKKNGWLVTNVSTVPKDNGANVIVSIKKAR